MKCMKYYIYEKKKKKFNCMLNEYTNQELVFEAIIRPFSTKNNRKGREQNIVIIIKILALSTSFFILILVSGLLIFIPSIFIFFCTSAV